MSHPEQRWFYRYVQSSNKVSIHVHVCKWKIGSRWQAWILLCLCAHVANKGSQCTVTTWYSKVMSANSYAEKGVLNEVIQNKLDLVQDHVPGQVIEVVEVLVALASCL